MTMMNQPSTVPARMSTDAAHPVVIAAGGTGGHFFPAEALAAALIARGHAVALLTDRRSGGQNSAVFGGSPVHVLHGAGIAGRGAARAARAIAALGAGTLQARAVLSKLQPSVIVGFGGYPCVAPVMGSRLLSRRPPIILHEQNAVLGRANRALARRATVLALSFSATTRLPPGAATAITGNPVRAAIARLAGGTYTPPDADGPLRLLVLGGSLGARVLSDVVPAALAALPAGMRGRLAVTQQCRAEDIESVRAAYRAAGIAAVLGTFFDDVATLLANAHLVIARAGASTVAELALVGRPAILVPLPAAIDDHQAANALSLGAGAWLMRQGVFSPESLCALIGRLFAEPCLLATASAAITVHARAHAADALADLVERTVALPQGVRT